MQTVEMRGAVATHSVYCVYGVYYININTYENGLAKFAVHENLRSVRY